MDNKILTKALHDNFSENQIDKCVELADEKVQVVAHAFGQEFHGRDEFRKFMMGFKEAFPDMIIAHNSILAEGEKVAVEFTAHGTHTGSLQTPSGEIPASGKKVSLNVVEIIEWKNGHVTKISNYQDSGSLMRQIGAM